MRTCTTCRRCARSFRREVTPAELPLDQNYAMKYCAFKSQKLQGDLPQAHAAPSPSQTSITASPGRRSRSLRRTTRVGSLATFSQRCALLLLCRMGATGGGKLTQERRRAGRTSRQKSRTGMSRPSPFFATTDDWASRTNLCSSHVRTSLIPSALPARA